MEPWDASGMNGGVDFDLDGQNGWDADEMFSKNERNFGVQSTFDDSLSDYTVAIDVKETVEFREAEAKAEKLAMEIESNPSTKDRLNLENGDEEALFAAVERPEERANLPQQQQQSQQPTPPPTQQQQQQQPIIDPANSSKVPPPVVSNKPKSAVLPTPPGPMNVTTTSSVVNPQSSNPVSNTSSSSSSSVSSSSTTKGTSTLSSGEKYIPPQQKRKPIPPSNNKNMSRITSSPNNIAMGHNPKNNYTSGHQSQQSSGPPQYATYNVHG